MELLGSVEVNLNITRVVFGGKKNAPPLDNSRDVVQMLREKTMEGRLSSVIEPLAANGGLIQPT